MVNFESLKNIRQKLTPDIVYNFLISRLKLAVAIIQDRQNDKNPLYRYVPPARLRIRVHGSLDKDAFYVVGNTIARNIRDLSGKAGRDIYSCGQILDFGCGSGRVISSFKEAPEQCRFHGSDIDNELICWCKENIPNVQWNTNKNQPPLPYASNSFDLIFSVGVFTILDEKSEHAWLAEIQRIARPGAVIILSINDRNKAPASLQTLIKSTGFLFLSGETGRRKADKIPYFYHKSYHTREYVNNKWSIYFDIIDYIEKGINNDEDVVLLKKR